MSIHLHYDARSDITNVCEVWRDENGKRRSKQIGSIRAYDRQEFNRRASECFSSSKDRDLDLDLEELKETEDTLTNVALNELFRVHQVILDRTYVYVPNFKGSYRLSDEDKVKIDEEIELRRAKWLEALEKAFKHTFRKDSAQEVLKDLAPLLEVSKKHEKLHQLLLNRRKSK